MLWLGLAIVVLIGAIVLLYRRSPVPPGPRYMQVVCQDEKGRVISREWVKLPDPDHYPEHGASYIGLYVERLLASKASFPTLAFFDHKGERGASLWRVDGKISVHLLFDVPLESEKEARAREFFRKLGADIDEDYLDGPGTTRLLSWWVADDAAEITILCQRVLTDLCGIDPSEGLNITFEEKERSIPR